MSDFIKLDPIKKIQGVVYLPGSKSISNRALLLAAQSVGTTRLINLLDSGDVRCMLNALCNLGVIFHLSKDRKICTVNGVGGALQGRNIYNKLIISVENAGTVMRPLLAALSIKPQDIILTGNARMLKRPISHLVEALRQGGAYVDYMEHDQYPPIRLNGGYCGGNIKIKGNISSQFLSSILMMAPLAPKDTCIKIEGMLVSKPYIDITLSVMKSFGVYVDHEDYRVFYCKGNSVYKSPGSYLVEGDASSASYFLAASAIKGGTVRTIGVGRDSIQGDIGFVNILEKMGAIIIWGENYIECSRGNKLSAVDLDANEIPDVAMTLAVMALFVRDGPMILRNIYNWRVKESDRLSAMATELQKLGAIVKEGLDFLYIFPPIKVKSSCIHTYDDHRIAMCFSLAALSDAHITINNPKCTYKTFPDFFVQLSNISIFQ
ncbi:3-phosphoshikimate 1-carboxyvinyltransferase [Candidatus Blochmannia ocreatus (nom. nud.)]|uniref:3-phosphoshikimate 1-carboxyvinyltransferase n=1 Tax=Candidatus Blochmannia ocreatus (nom. nud.) TaxID=251538 RepID=A0ABY4SYH3_9ENTR|nr:3-phosphoshikimate 1-carboxyvinyltransferase [Candidatus Blochmannia ocreatus]URJ24889.1 3-phosphoshikimate 1-carboxyvinyltransferase [Candidatus Blochmannia ocreatus]